MSKLMNNLQGFFYLLTEENQPDKPQECHVVLNLSCAPLILNFPHLSLEMNKIVLGDSLLFPLIGSIFKNLLGKDWFFSCW